jgi:hypothetical protein
VNKAQISAAGQGDEQTKSSEATLLGLATFNRALSEPKWAASIPPRLRMQWGRFIAAGGRGIEQASTVGARLHPPGAS